MNATGIKSPGRRGLRDADKRKAMSLPTMNIRHMPLVVQEDKDFYELFLESKELESKRDPASRAKFNECLNRMRARWALLTNNDEAKAESHQRVQRWLI